MKLCFNTIACRNSGKPLLEDLSEIAGTGYYRAVELWMPGVGVPDGSLVEAVQGFCLKAGWDFPVVSTYLGLMSLAMDDRERHCELCEGVAQLARRDSFRYVRAFPGMVGQVSSRRPDPFYYEYLVESFRKFCRILGKAGLTLLSETHRDTMADTAAGARRFIRDVGEDNHGLILQLGIVPRWSSMDAVGFYRSLAPYIKHMHLHPYPVLEHEDNPEHYGKLLPLLGREKPPFYISIENCDGHVPPLETARCGAELIRKTVGG